MKLRVGKDFKGRGREGEEGRGEGEGRRGRKDEEGKQLRGMEEYLGKGTIAGEGK